MNEFEPWDDSYNTDDDYEVLLYTGVVVKCYGKSGYMWSMERDHEIPFQTKITGKEIKGIRKVMNDRPPNTQSFYAVHDQEVLTDKEYCEALIMVVLQKLRIEIGRASGRRMSPVEINQFTHHDLTQNLNNTGLFRDLLIQPQEVDETGKEDVLKWNIKFKLDFAIEEYSFLLEFNFRKEDACLNIIARPEL